MLKKLIHLFGYTLAIITLLTLGGFLIIQSIPQFNGNDEIPTIIPIPENSAIRDTTASIGVGNERPIFNLHLANGELQSITNFDQHVIVIQFLEPTCTKCFDQISVLEKVYEQAVYEDRGLLTIILIERGKPEESQNYSQYLSSFAQENFILATDEIGLYNTFLGNTNFTIARVIINIDSKVMYIDTEFEDYERLYAKVKELI